MSHVLPGKGTMSGAPGSRTKAAGVKAKARPKVQSYKLRTRRGKK